METGIATAKLACGKPWDMAILILGQRRCDK